MLVLCDHCHRDETHGLHHLLYSEWVAQGVAYDGVVIVDKRASMVVDLQKDEQIVDADVPIDERA